MLISLFSTIRYSYLNARVYFDYVMYEKLMRSYCVAVLGQRVLKTLDVVLLKSRLNLS